MSADHRHTTWRKSSHSNGNGGTCVELAHVQQGTAIRDSKNPVDRRCASLWPRWPG